VRALSLSEQEPEVGIVLGASMAEAGLLLDGADDPSSSCFDAEWDDAHESGFDDASLDAANKSCFGVTLEHDRAVGTRCRNNMDYLMCHFCAPQQVRVLALSACARITAF
jgi:hypothetical protein